MDHLLLAEVVRGAEEERTEAEERFLCRHRLRRLSIPLSSLPDSLSHSEVDVEVASEAEEEAGRMQTLQKSRLTTLI